MLNCKNRLLSLAISVLFERNKVWEFLKSFLVCFNSKKRGRKRICFRKSYSLVLQLSVALENFSKTYFECFSKKHPKYCLVFFFIFRLAICLFLSLFFLGFYVFWRLCLEITFLILRQDDSFCDTEELQTLCAYISETQNKEFPQIKTLEGYTIQINKNVFDPVLFPGGDIFGKMLPISKGCHF